VGAQIGNAMTVFGLDHVQLAMPAGREEEADAFYRDLLGFDVGPKPDSALAHCEPGYPARGRSLAGERLSSLRSLVAACAGLERSRRTKRSE
jgi:catechol 2,3-dioxygenase-like lactoylglutathione lyase family enzyme